MKTLSFKKHYRYHLFAVTGRKIIDKYNSITEFCCKLPSVKIQSNPLYINRKSNKFAPPNTKLCSICKTEENFITLLIYKTLKSS